MAEKKTTKNEDEPVIKLADPEDPVESKVDLGPTKDAVKKDPVEIKGLTDRQRTRLEKRDAAVADPTEGDDSRCDNHPGREAVFTSDGVLHSPQSYCEECATNAGIVLPNK